MHELSIVESMVSMADGCAKERGIKNIAYITVQVGTLTGVIPHYLSMYYADVTKGTALEGSELKIEEVAAEAFCRACGEVFDPSNETHCCPACGAEDYELLHGRELTIKDMGFTEE
mgnify:CR=1 FL=1